MTPTPTPEHARHRFARADLAPAPSADERYRRLADFLLRLYLDGCRAKRTEGSTT